MAYDMDFSNFQNTIIFADAYPNPEEFFNDYLEMMSKMAQSQNPPITEKNVFLLYWLLYAQYANSSFANYDLNQVKAKLFSIIFMYGPTWQKRAEIQLKLRNLTEDEILAGAKQITNHANNPATVTTADEADGGLPYIDQQNTHTYKKSKIAGYAELWEMLKVDVNKEFIDRFHVLFRKVIAPAAPLYYHNNPEDTQI